MTQASQIGKKVCIMSSVRSATEHRMLSKEGVSLVRAGYRVMEVPVTKTYPRHELGYTKMRPIIDWWSILRPVVYLGLGLKK